jgi:hypothetical protein
LGLVATVGAFVAFSGTANADLLWYDGFAIVDPDDSDGPGYTVGNLADQQGGSGLGPGGVGPGFFDDALGDPNPWLGVNSVDASAEDSHVELGSLEKSFQNFPSTGGKATANPPVFDCCYQSRQSRDFNTPMTQVNGTVYMSFLVNFGDYTVNERIRPNLDSMGYRSVEFWGGKHPVDPDDGSENDGRVGDPLLNMSIGVSSFGNYDDPENDADPDDANTINRQLSVRVDGIYEEFGLPEEKTYQLEEHLEYADDLYHARLGRTHCIVIKFDLSTFDKEIGGEGDTVSFWLDPPDADVETTPSLVVSGVDLDLDSMSNMIAYHFQGLKDQPGAFDELRVGTTWGDVACCDVPEPATFALFGIGALGLVMFVRRKVS